jgi:hypothetical protein
MKVKKVKPRKWVDPELKDCSPLGEREEKEKEFVQVSKREYETILPHCFESFPSAALSESYAAYEDDPEEIDKLLAQDEEIWDYYRQMHPYDFEGDE